jgi:Transcriptional regulator
LKNLDKKQKIILSIAVSCTLIVSIIIAAIFWSTQNIVLLQKTVGDFDITYNPTLSKDYYGILVLGSDQGATRTNGGNHTDSMTYVAINKRLNKAYALPIYRDTFVYDVCNDVNRNANQFYRDVGVECLKNSLSEMLDLPIDYYMYITSNGFVDVLNDLAPLMVTAEATYCSDRFGNNDINYCFDNGVTYEMDGNELLAYTRYRGNTSGESRANRHIQVLDEIYTQCLNKADICLRTVYERINSGDIQTDIVYEEIIDLKMPTHLENLGIIAGSNFQDESGWHQRHNQDDLNEKANRIKNEIFI